MSRRAYKRDHLGRFSGAGTKVSATAKGARTAAKAASKTGARKVHKSYVKGSFEKNLEVGQDGSLRTVQLGADFRSPKGRAVRVRASAGYHGKPNRRLDIAPALDKRQKKLTVTAKPNPAASRKSSAGQKLKR